MTRRPALAKAVASGSPTYPSPRMPTLEIVVSLSCKVSRL